MLSTPKRMTKNNPLNTRQKDTNCGQALMACLVSMAIAGTLAVSIQQMTQLMVRNAVSVEDKGRKTDLVNYVRSALDCAKTINGLTGACEGTQSISVSLRDANDGVLVGTADDPTRFVGFYASGYCRRSGTRYDFFVYAKAVSDSNGIWKPIQKVPFTCE